MAISNRAAIIAHLQKALKKLYKPITPVVGNRNVLENLLFACCLEDSPHELAEECFATIQELYFDWNELRVTTVRELCEIFQKMPSPMQTATSLKGALQSIFESQYSFDLEQLKKQNLGKAVAILETFKGVTPFMLAYVTQHSLGGHAIPLGQSELQVMHIVGVIDDAEFAASNVPGLDRAVSKTQGVEFASLLHQLASELVASPFSTTVRTKLLEIAPDCKNRLPKRSDAKKPSSDDKAAAAPPKRKTTGKPSTADKKASPTVAAKGRSDEAAAKSKAKTSAQSAAKKEKDVAKKPPLKKTTSPKSPEKKDSGKKDVSKKIAKTSSKKPTGKKSTSKQLARRKPR